MEESKLPYRVEYAKSGRAGCKGCKDPISKDSLRLAVMVQSPFFDGMQPKWYHYSCFFGKFRPKTTADIAHFESIRWEDQEEIKKKIESALSNPVIESSSGKGKGSKSKKRGNANPVDVPGLSDFTLQYAKSKRAKCKYCEETIEKDEIRISKKDYESEIAMKYGPVERWHHLDCFVKIRDDLEFFASGEILPGFKSLTPEDKKMLKSKIPAVAKPTSTADASDGPSPAKKLKESENESLKKKLKRQNDGMFKYHDLLQTLKTSELKLLLEYNKQEIPEGSSMMIERLSDAMAFGALKKCEKCGGQLSFSSGRGYVCHGYSNEWLKCEAVTTNPSKVPFKVPSELKEKYSFLNTYKGKVLERLVNENQIISKTSSAVNGTKTVKKPPLLWTLKFFIHKTENKGTNDITKHIEKLGGTVVKKYEDDVVAVVSNKAEMSKSKISKTLKSAEKSGIPVVTESLFDDITESTSKKDLITKINENKISTWESDVTKKIKIEDDAKKKKSLYSVQETKSMCTMKDGLVVDPTSGLDAVAHVYRKGKDIYSAVLSLVDVQSGKNSYYKMQILEGDKKNKYWFFRSWGRIGTTIGGSKCEQYGSLDECIEMFETTFEEQTGNEWVKRKKFKKIPGKKIMVDIDYKDPKEGKVKPKEKVNSKFLTKSVQDLITLIFDIEAMERTMLEFELDLNKMPLGKLSQKQIHSAFEILSSLQNFAKEKKDRTFLIEKTNMFYSLVPHSFGVEMPPLLDNEDIIKQKIDMLNSLMDIEIAYNLLQVSENSENSIDEQYKKLNTQIIDLDPKSDEYKTIELYVKNTHAKTHMNYSLEIENVFKIERSGEAERYEKFSKLPNRKLLWHGSRVTNFAGILSQGLRIAPPEAPATGYMFGKGIYFADMVSKSANYCNTNKKNNTGLILLCEVALGEMLELTKAKYIQKLPSGKNSVKGVGRTQPDPAEVVITPTGAEVPIGKGIDAKIKESALLYNEYIVYKMDQVKIQYLLRLKFHHKD